jgi:HEAT repeat protein
LIEALKDVDAGVRERAARALGCIDPAAALPALVDALKDDSYPVRGTAAWAIGRTGSSAVAAIPQLYEALRTADYYVRAFVQEALAEIRSESQGASGPGACQRSG